MVNTRTPEPKEVVGSKDLRESFKESDRIRGSWFINGVELHQFEANSPASVVAQINAKTGAHYVTAEIDNEGHLVLIDKSGADIQIGLGAPYVNAGPTSSGDVAKDVLQNLKHEQEKDRHERRGNQVLDQLGLEASDRATAGTGDQALAQSGALAGFETGLSAEERKERWRRENGLSNSSQLEPTRANSSQQASGAGVDKSGAPQIPSNPTPGTTSGAGGKLDDGRGRQGTGGGQGETAGATIERQHSGAGQQPAPVPGA